MNVGIDWVSLGIFAVAYVIAQIRTVPPRVRYIVLAVAMGAIAANRMCLPAAGVNLAFTALAAGLAVWYLIQAFRAPSRWK